MAFRDLREAVAALEERGRIMDVHEELDPKHEVSAFISLAVRQRKTAFRFHAIKGWSGQAVANLFHARDVMAWGMGVSEDEVVRAFAARVTRPLPCQLVTDTPVTEVTHTGGIDLTALMPILTHYAGDSGPYLCSGMAAMRDPDTGLVERGICRMELRGPDELGIAVVNPPLSALWPRLVDRPEHMKLAVSVGLEPLSFLAPALPPIPGVDKLALGGGLRGEPIEIFAGPYTGLEMPARAEFLLEGDLEAPGRPDGPFGETSGYYLTFPCTPTLRVRRVSTRRDPIYHALLPTGGEADIVTALTVEAQISQQARDLFPYLGDFVFAPSTFGASLIVTVRRTERTRARSLLHYLLSLDRVKKVVLVADDVDPSDPQEVEWSIITRCQPDADVVVFEDLRAHPIDPSYHEGGRASRIGIDATGFERVQGKPRVGFPPAALERAREALGAVRGREQHEAAPRVSAG